MANDYFQFKQFTVWQQHCAMKVTTDGCLLGAWAARTMVDGGQITDDKLSLPVMPSAKETGVHGYSDAPQPSTINRPSAAILDIGTGTGLLSLMLAQKTDLSIDAVEIDPAAAEQARQNCKASPWGHRIRVITGNIIQLAPGQRYTTIISNPPFFENQLASPHVGRQKALHATELSLAALLLAIDQHLHPQGMAFIMLPAYREPEIAALMAPYGFCLRQLVTVRHSPNHPPFRILIQLGREAATPLPYELVIRENDGGYSEAFNALLKDYYLHL